jgi:hypothetical protein
MTCPPLKLTLSAPSLGFDPLIFTKFGDGGKFYQRAVNNSYKSLGKSLAGGNKLSRLGFKSYFTWSISAILTEAQTDLWMDYYSSAQDDITNQFVLSDEHSYVPALQTTWHNRTVISGSTVSTSGGRSKSFINANVFLQVEESSGTPEIAGNGIWLVQAIFEELI